MNIRLTSNSGRPLYRQIIEQISYKIAAGQLPHGTRLPPVRRLAEQLAINPNTAARAYRDLEASGLLMTKPGSGVFVAKSASPLSWREKQRVINQQIDRLLSLASQLNLEDRTLTRLIDERRVELAKAHEEAS